MAGGNNYCSYDEFYKSEEFKVGGLMSDGDEILIGYFVFSLLFLGSD